MGVDDAAAEGLPSTVVEEFDGASCAEIARVGSGVAGCWSAHPLTPSTLTRASKDQMGRGNLMIPSITEHRHVPGPDTTRPAQAPAQVRTTRPRSSHWARASRAMPSRPMARMTTSISS